MKSTFACTCCLLLAGFVFGGEPPRPEQAARHELVDMHLHYLDFIQESDGFEKLTEKMDEAGVSHAVVFGMAMAKQWDEAAPKRPTYYLSNDSRAYYFSGTDHLLLQEYLRQPPKTRERFFPFVCGINPNDRYAAKQLRQLLDMYPGEIYGIGELMSRHDDLTALTYGEPPRADHPALLEVYDLAAEFGLPVLIHHNISGSYMKEPIYLEEMQRALAHNRDANIIWAHVGVSRRVEVEGLPDIADDMLANNPNLFFDISWVVFDEHINKDADSLRRWADLLEKYPTRFMIGSDKVGHWSTYRDEIVKYYPLIDMLSEGAKRQICTENILRLINVQRKALRIAS